VRLDPLPSAAALAEIYEPSYRDGLYAMFAKPTTCAAAPRAPRRRDRAAHPAGPWLDVGCSTGALLQAVVERGIEAEGLDLSASRSRRHARAACMRSSPRGRVRAARALRLHHRVRPRRAPDRPEPVPRPRAHLARAGRAARDHAADIKSLHARRDAQALYYYAPPVHVNYFDRDTIVACSTVMA